MKIFKQFTKIDNIIYILNLIILFVLIGLFGITLQQGMYAEMVIAIIFLIASFLSLIDMYQYKKQVIKEQQDNKELQELVEHYKKLFLNTKNKEG